MTAAKYDDGLLLDRGTAVQPDGVENQVVCNDPKTATSVTLPQAGIYQIDVHTAAIDKPAEFTLKLGERQFISTLTQPAFLVARLPAGALAFKAEGTGWTYLDRVVFTPLPAEHEVSRKFAAFEKRSPRVGVHLGLRRDCGSTLNPVGPPQTVANTNLERFVFEGAIRNFPSPDVEADNVNYLAGIREIGVRSEYTDGRDIPRLLVRSVEFEGPLYDAWPPASHRNLLDSDRKDNPQDYAREILRAFATRAFRRPVTETEESALMGVFSGHSQPGRGSRRA